MLHDFIRSHRAEILQRARLRVAERRAPLPTQEELENGIPLFLEELIEMLASRDLQPSSAANAATRHGHNRFAMGFTIAQVVHDYGDVCQVVTELAIETKAALSTEDFRALNGCLDDAIANAVTEHRRASQSQLTQNSTESLGVLAHELRNYLNTAMVSYEILKTGAVSIGGSTGALLGRSLTSLRDLVDRSLAEVRLEAGLLDSTPIDVAAFLVELEFGSAIAARFKGVSLTTAFGAADVRIRGDHQLLSSATTNLLQNALKFTRPGGHVKLCSTADAKRVLIEVEDECGGLSADVSDNLFRAFHRGKVDESGMGLGLTIAKSAVEAMHGELRVRNEPGRGCTFTIDLPRDLG